MSGISMCRALCQRPGLPAALLGVALGSSSWLAAGGPARPAPVLASMLKAGSTWRRMGGVTEGTEGLAGIIRSRAARAAAWQVRCAASVAQCMAAS